MLRLKIIEGREEDPRILGGTQVTIGRGPENTIALPGARGLSRRHAAITVDGDRCRIEDLSSRNGVFVNGRRIEVVDVAAGDRVRMGTVLLVIEDFSADDAPLQAVRPASAVG